MGRTHEAYGDERAIAGGSVLLLTTLWTGHFLSSFFLSRAASLSVESLSVFTGEFQQVCLVQVGIMYLLLRK